MPFFNNCTNAFKPPPGSLADEADNQLDTYFPAIHKNLPNIVLVQAKKTGQFHEVVGNTTYTKAYNNLTADNGIALRKFTQAIQDRLGEFDHKEIIPPDGFTSYGSLVAAGYAPLVADQFLNDDHSATMITIMTSYGHTAITNEFVAYLDDAIEHALDRTGTRDLLEARQTGMGSWALDAITGMIGDMAKMDSIAFPLALGTLAYMIRSVRLMVLPCICIMVSLCTSMGVIMYPLSHAMQVIAFAPSVMMSATIAVSVDYSLFLLSRFREEILLGAEPMAAITTMLATAGHTVLVSGLTLVLSFSGLIFFPVNFLYSVGTGASIAVACSIACALNLCPCLMIQFIDFFGTVDPLPSCCRSCCPNKDKSATLQTGGSLQTALVVKDKELAEYESIHATAWFRISKVGPNKWPQFSRIAQHSQKAGNVSGHCRR